MITKLGRILEVDITLGGTYNHEMQLVLVLGADTWNGQPDSKWFVKAIEILGYAQLGDCSSMSLSKLVPLLHSANVTRLSELVSKPVLCSFNNETLHSWRLLSTL